MDIVYQIRNIHSGRLIDTKASEQEAIDFLNTRSPKEYEVFCVHTLSGEVRSIIRGSTLTGMTIHYSDKVKPLEFKFRG